MTHSSGNSSFLYFANIKKGERRIAREVRARASQINQISVESTQAPKENLVEVTEQSEVAEQPERNLERLSIA